MYSVLARFPKLFLMTLVLAPALTYAQGSCKVYLDIQFKKYESNIEQKLLQQGFELVTAQAEGSFFLALGACAERACAMTDATLYKVDSEDQYGLLEVRGYAKYPYFLHRRSLANRIALKMIDVLPSCEEALNHTGRAAYYEVQ